MKTFKLIVATILQQGSIVSFDSPAWTKAEMYDEVSLGLDLHLYYANMSDDENDALESDKDYAQSFFIDSDESNMTCMRG